MNKTPYGDERPPQQDEGQKVSEKAVGDLKNQLRAIVISDEPINKLKSKLNDQKNQMQEIRNMVGKLTI